MDLARILVEARWEGATVEMWYRRRVCGYLSMTKGGNRGDSALELYLFVARVNMSQSGVVEVAEIPGSASRTSIISACRNAVAKSNMLDCVDCGGCLLDARLSQSWWVSVHGLVHRSLEVNITSLE